MPVLRLADPKLAAMDKLYYYILQTDRMLQKYITDAEEQADVLLAQNTWKAMETTQPTGTSDDEEEEDDIDKDNDGEDVDVDNTQSVDSDISEEEKQVLMIILLRLFNLFNSMYASYSHQQQ